MRRCVWSRNLKNEEAMARVGPQRHKKKKSFVPTAYCLWLITVDNDNPMPLRQLIFLMSPWLLPPRLSDQTLLEASSVRPFSMITSDICAHYSVTNRLLRCRIFHACFRVTLLTNVLSTYMTGRATKGSLLSVAGQFCLWLASSQGTLLKFHW